MALDETWLAATFGLSGRSAVVTGGTRGIGYMIAEGLLRAGAEVVICSRSAADCDEAVDRLSLVGPAHGAVCDLSTESGTVALSEHVAARQDSVDILVNNAGTAWGAPLDSYPEEGWDKVMALNLKAPFMLTRHLLPLLSRGATREGPARVINIGSIDGLIVPTIPNYAYSASKAAVHHLTHVLARELAASHVLVNAIAPGPFESRMTAWALEDHEDVIAASSPLGRIGAPLDIAAAAVFLAGAGSGYVTGAVVPVDGGIATTATSGRPPLS